MRNCIYFRGELIYNGIIIHQRQFTDRYEKIEEYNNKTESVGRLLEIVERLEKENSLYRVEILDDAVRTNNDGYLYAKNTLTMYSSTEKKFAWNLFYNWGWGEPGSHAKYNNSTTNLARSVSGIKYIVSSKELENNEMELIEEIGEYKLYKNKIAMPFAFLVNDSALEISNQKRADYVQFHNDVYHGLLGSYTEDIYRKVKEEKNDIKNKLEKKEDYFYTDGNYLYSEDIKLLKNTIAYCNEQTLNVESVKASKINGVFVNETEKEQFVCFTIPYEKAWNVTVDGEKVNTYEGMGGFLLVPMEIGEHVIELEYRVPLGALGMCTTFLGILLCILDRKIWRRWRNRTEDK